MADYSRMTTDEYVEILGEIVEEGANILSVDGVYEALSADTAIHNDVLGKWAERNPEKAWPEEVDDAT